MDCVNDDVTLVVLTRFLDWHLKGDGKKSKVDAVNVHLLRDDTQSKVEQKTISKYPIRSGEERILQLQ